MFWRHVKSQYTSVHDICMRKDSTLNDGDKLSCTLVANNACASNSQATSNNINIKVNPILNAEINILSSSMEICEGSEVFFTSSVINACTTPFYQWTKNGISLEGKIDTSYSDSTLQNVNLISCILTSIYVCQASTSSGVM